MNIIVKNSLITILLFILFSNCDNNTEIIPQVDLLETNEINPTSVFFEAETMERDIDIIEKGISWSLNNNPTKNDSNIDLTLNEFETKISNLLPNTDYFFRAYMSNSEGLYYSNEIKIKTLEVSKPPCEIAINYLNIGGYEDQAYNFETEISNFEVKYKADYIEITGGLTSHNLQIRFEVTPETNQYETVNIGNLKNSKSACSIYGTFPIGAYPEDNAFQVHYAREGQIIYVEETENNKFRVAFCNLEILTIGQGQTLELDGHIEVEK